MIYYTISCLNRLSQIIQINLSFEAQEEELIELRLPAWRPGRYEFQTYARNIFAIQAHGPDKQSLPIHKTERNSWQIATPTKGKIEILYQYSCTQLDAGGSWIDDALIYINPINCLLYPKDKEHEPCELTLAFSNMQMQPASHLIFSNNSTQTANYFELADSPFFISEQQRHEQYQVKGITFHVWTHGEIVYSTAQLLTHFEAFTTAQLTAMGSFPENEYHFLLLLFPFTHYHGVEHHRSTVITLGPAQDLSKPTLYEELISISSHELYHAWNICKIRPREMYPYRLHEENYFRTGFVAEGITTYLGEYFLRQSGFFSEERFLLEIEQWFNRHRMHRGLERASLSDSSFDLWVDGYATSSADYKVSIYVAGALSAITLDLQIRLLNPGHSLFDLMRILYQEKALKQEGYTESSFQKYLSQLIGEESKNFWKHCITGHSVDTYLISLLDQFGISVSEEHSLYTHERFLGIQLKAIPSKIEIAKLKLTSPGAQYFMVDDIILSVNGQAPSSVKDMQLTLDQSSAASFEVLRKGRKKSFTVPFSKENYWDKTIVQKNSGASEEQQLRYKEWMKELS